MQVVSAKEEGFPPPLLPSLDVEVEFGNAQYTERELVQGVQHPYLVVTPGQEVVIAPLLQLMKSLGYPLSNAMISYYSVVAGLYVYCGNDPLHHSITVPLYEFTENRLRLRCREATRNEFGSTVVIAQGLPQYKASEVPRSPALRRTKERKIGYIIDKVMEWRTLYNGTTNSDGEEVKCTLEQAASEVSISKKSLDDYLLQLR